MDSTNVKYTCRVQKDPTPLTHVLALARSDDFTLIEKMTASSKQRVCVEYSDGRKLSNVKVSNHVLQLLQCNDSDCTQLLEDLWECAQAGMPLDGIVPVSGVDDGVANSADRGEQTGDSGGDDAVDHRVWKEPEVQALIATRSEMAQEFGEQGYKSHGFLWNQVAAKITALPGSQRVTVEQCKNKWKALKKTFMLTYNENLHRSRNERKICKFYDQFLHLYSDKASRRPTCVLSSSNLGNDTAIDPEVEPVPKKRRQSHTSTLAWAERHEEETKAYRETMLAMRKEEVATHKAYQEKRLAVLDRILVALEKQ